MNKTVLVFNYKKINRYSIAALIGSLEIDNRFNNLNIRLVKDREDFPQVLSNLISNFQKIIVAFSFMTPEAFNMHNLIQKLKSKKSNNVIFVAGGSHPSGDFKGTLKMGFDIVIIGEGEKTFPELLFRIMNNQTYTDIKGIAYKKDEKVIFTGPDEPINLDLYPPFAEKHKLFSPIEITRGCTFGCKFCQTTFLFKGIRHRSVPNVCKYVKIMMSEKLTDIRFITPNAFSYGSSDGKKLNLEAIENLLKSIRDIIKNKGRIFFGTFPSEVRPEFVNEETIRLIKTYTNNDNLVIGAQSGSPRILKECKRGHTIDDIYKAVELTLEAGLKVNVDFIFGLKTYL
ncbi:MAG: TIGR04013 family B12-binding domain/radical SAM domain-containing protein [Methanosarcinales archaeon]